MMETNRSPAPMERQDIEALRFLQETGGTCGLAPLTGPSFPVGGEHRPVIRDGFGYREPVLSGVRRTPGEEEQWLRSCFSIR